MNSFFFIGVVVVDKASFKEVNTHVGQKKTLYCQPVFKINVEAGGLINIIYFYFIHYIVQ